MTLRLKPIGDRCLGAVGEDHRFCIATIETSRGPRVGLQLTGMAYPAGLTADEADGLADTLREHAKACRRSTN